MHRRFMITGALFGALSVALGAFGAHGLKNIVTPAEVSIFQTGVQYQMYHALALLITALAYERLAGRLANWACYFFCAGIFFFSGSLYLITALHAFGREVPVYIGVMTPAGGLSFICGWLALFAGIVKKKSV